MKKTVLLLLFVFTVSGAHAIDFYSQFSADSIIPLKDNAYNVIWGGGYGFKLVEGRFVFVLGAKGFIDSAKAVYSDGRVYGLYKDDWALGPFEADNITDVNSLYIAGELSASFGWHISYIFERDQYIFITLAAMLESETFSGDVEKQFLAGRYSTALSLSSEIFKVADNPVYLTLSFGSASLQDPVKSGNAFYFFRTSLTYETEMKFIREVDKYRRSDEMEKEGKEQEGEGGAVWEE